MPTAGYEPAIPETERSQTHALDRAATGIGLQHRIIFAKFCTLLGKRKPSDYSVHCKRFLRDIGSHIQN